MSEATGCSGSCASCPSKGNCGKPQSLLEPANSLSDIKKVIAVVSGKGGVGKSMVTSSLAVMMQRRGFSTAILDAAALGFLGLGVQPPAAEWGDMLGRGRNELFRAPWLMIFPGMAITLTVLAFNLLGDGIRDGLDPKARKR